MALTGDGSMSTKQDIEKARQIIKQDCEGRYLHTDSSSIYRSTNENMNDSNYIELLKDNKSILSVIGSGDQILNSILLGSLDIDAFDINRFVKYYLEFKMSAIISLSYEEYLSFFYDKKTFNRKLYSKVIDNMKGESKEFWQNIANYKGLTFGKDKYSPKEVYNSSLFIPGTITKENAINNNPYLSRKDYYLLKNKINEAKIRYFNGNIFELAKTLDRDYDFINLSNIGMYTRDFILPQFNNEPSDDYKNFISNLRLNPDGKVLNYLMGYVKGSLSYNYAVRAVVNDPNYDIHIVKNKDHIDDALAVYRKRR